MLAQQGGTGSRAKRAGGYADIRWVFDMHAKRLYVVCESLSEVVVEYVEYVVMMVGVGYIKCPVVCFFLVSSFQFIDLFTLELRLI